MNFRPDTSFPYLAIARRFDVPYAEVLVTVDQLELGLGKGQLLPMPPLLDCRVTRAVYSAWHAEKARRRAIGGGK